MIFDALTYSIITIALIMTLIICRLSKSEKKYKSKS